MLLSSSGLIALALPLLASVVSASRNITGALAYTDALPDRSACPVSTKAYLDGGAQWAFVLADGSFTFQDVSPGFHTVSLVCPAHKFLPLLVAVPSDETAQPFVTPHNPSKLPPFALDSLPAANLSLPYPLALRSAAREEFFEARKGFEVGGMLKNPMILMMGLSAVLMFALPYITSQLDPELVKEASAMLQPASTPSSSKASRKELPAAPASSSSPSSVTAAAVAAGGPAKRGGKKARK